MTKDGAYCFNWKEKKSPASLRYSSEWNDVIWVALVYVRRLTLREVHRRALVIFKHVNHIYWKVEQNPFVLFRKICNCIRWLFCFFVKTWVSFYTEANIKKVVNEFFLNSVIL